MVFCWIVSDLGELNVFLWVGYRVTCSFYRITVFYCGRFFFRIDFDVLGIRDSNGKGARVWGKGDHPTRVFASS